MSNNKKESHRSSKRTLVNVSDYLTLEWNYCKNGELTPFNVTIHDQRKLSWVCQHCGGEFQATVKKRYYKKMKCPYCLGKGKKGTVETCSVEQSLAYLFPYLMREWHPELNDHLNAFELLPQAGVPVWWVCQAPQCQHQWRTPVFNRTYQRSDCPVCTHEKKVQQQKELQ